MIGFLSSFFSNVSTFHADEVEVERLICFPIHVHKWVEKIFSLSMQDGKGSARRSRHPPGQLCMPVVTEIEFVKAERRSFADSVDDPELTGTLPGNSR